MSGVDWNLVSEIFADALEQPPDARSAYVAARCGRQADVLAAVERLLDAEAAAEPAFMMGLDPGSMAAVIRAVADAPETVGPYRLVRELGRGGMGQVFLAERADGQFDQRAAVKLLKRGMDSDAILTRFLRERQILAALDHPNIARLFDGGITQDGRPYFVMEYVQGQPITRFCDEHRLSIDERLQLFCLVCLAVEYAHRNLVVHRDLKPSNILITADGQPKLLDFGIAKLLSAERCAADATTLTQAGARMLTPEYAAPEQFYDGPITTSTDVYSLGALLYELLAGHRPFAGREKQGVPAPMADEEAPSITRAMAAATGPAERGDTSSPEAIAAARSTDPARLRQRLGGDLETIVAMALRRLPERRYASVEALRDDIHRHQQRLPVKARPDTTLYRVSRFVRRHRIGVLSASAVIAVVLTFGGTAAVQAIQIRKQARELEVERDRARSEAAAAESVSDFLVGVFEVSDPMAQGRGDSIRARELLDRGAERIETDLEGEPELQARMLTVMGKAYYNLSRGDRAEPLLQRAVELQRAAAGDTSAAVIAALQELANVQELKGNHRAAEATLREALARQERVDADGSAMPKLLVKLATVLHKQGEVAQVTATVGDALDRLERASPEASAASRATLRDLATFLGYAREWEKLDAVHRRLVQLEQSTAGPRSEALAIAYADWAATRQRRGDLQTADSLSSFALAIFREVRAPSVATAHALLALAAVAGAVRAPDRADSLFRAAIEIYRARLGEHHRLVANARTLQASHLQRRGRHAEAIPLLDGAIETFRRETESVEGLLIAEWKLAVALRGAGRLVESDTMFRRALQDFETRFPPDYILTANVRQDYGEALIELDRPREAEPVLRQAIRVLARRWGENDFRVDDARVTLGRALTALGRYAEAEDILGGALQRLEQARGPDDPRTRRARQAYESLEHARSDPGG